MGVYADWKTVPSFVNTLLLKGLGDMFSNPQKGVFESFTEMRKSGSNLNNLTLAGGTQGMRRWRGSKVFNQIKAFSLNVETGNWEWSLIIDKDPLQYAQPGAPGAAASLHARTPRMHAGAEPARWTASGDSRH